MRRKILPLVLGGALSVAAIAPAAAAPPDAVTFAGGLVNVVVQNVLNDSLNDVVDASDSLNNALQNVAQNARILNGLEVRIVDVLNDLDVNVSDINITVLENGDVLVTVLGTGGIIDTITFS